MLLWVLLSSGSATFNEVECQLADWKAIGYEDGGKEIYLARAVVQDMHHELSDKQHPLQYLGEIAWQLKKPN